MPESSGMCLDGSGLYHLLRIELLSRPKRRRMFSTGPAFTFRPEPATHQRARRARRGAL